MIHAIIETATDIRRGFHKIKHESEQPDNVYLIGCIIICALAAALLFFSANAYLKPKRNDARCPVAMSGTVVSSRHHSTSGKSKLERDRKKYSDIIVRYDGPDGEQLAFSRDSVPGYLNEGDSIPIRCSENLKEAVIYEDTRPNYVEILVLLFLGLVFGYKGFPLLFGEIRLRLAASRSDE